MLKKSVLLVLFIFLLSNSFSYKLSDFTCTNLVAGMEFDESFAEDVVVVCPGTFNLSGGITLAKENLVFDCGLGATIEKRGLAGLSKGIVIKDKKNITVKNCAIKGFGTGIFTSHSWFNLINNTVTQNRMGIHVRKLTVEAFYSAEIIDNTVNDNIQQGIVLSAGVRGAHLAGNTINNNGTHGIDAQGIGSFTFENNIITNNKEQGILLNGALGGNLTSNTVEGNSKYGFKIFNNSNDVLVRNNTLKNNIEGGIFVDSENIRFSNNIVESNPVGLKIETNANDLLLSENQFCNNTTVDISCYSAGPTTFSNDSYDLLEENGCTFVNKETTISCAAASEPPSPVNGDLIGLDPDFYAKEVDGSKTTFTLASGNVYFYSTSISVVASPEELDSMDYFIKIPVGTILMPCNEEGCVFSEASPPNSVEFTSSVSGIILDGGTIDLTGSNINALHLVIQGDLTSASNKTGTILASGKNGSNGTRKNCFTSAGENAGTSGNIAVRGTVFVLDSSVLIFNSSGAKGGNGVNGIVEYDCSRPNGTNGGNGAKGGNIELEKLNLSRNSGQAKFLSDGGNGGTRGTGTDYFNSDGTSAGTGSDGINGLGQSAGNSISVKQLIISGDNPLPLTQPKLFFSGFKSEVNPASNAVDSTALINGCDLETKLIIAECKLKDLQIGANDVIEFMASPASNINVNCVLPRTKVTPKINCSCYSGSLEETEMIFSLTGTAKSFSGDNLSGTFKNFSLLKEIIASGESSTQEILSDSQSHDFSNGFFNFSFGKGQTFFPSLGSLAFNTRYLLDFMVNAMVNSVELSSDSRGEFKLSTGEETEEACG